MTGSKIHSVLMLSPEPPYPLHSGGAYRTASLVHYFARFAEVDLILVSERGVPALLPDGLVRSQTVIPLPRHSRGPAARFLRNARRAVRGVPPLIDRLSGLESAVTHAIGDRKYDLGIVEHFWCAPYFRQMRESCAHLVLDLHNIESVLHARCAEVEHSTPGDALIALGHRRFAATSRNLEAALLPEYDLCLATSERDRRSALEIAPGARVEVYPNALPCHAPPEPRAPASPPLAVFSGNFEYHPNIDAVRYLADEIWPRIRALRSDLRLRLVGRGDRFVRHLLPPDAETTGPVQDAAAEIAAADVVLAPLRTGSGTRIKILEAWSAGRPVVATPLAAEGLECLHGENILLASTPADFARAVASVLSDPVLRERVAHAGRRTFEESYTWKAAWRQFDAVMQHLPVRLPQAARGA